jgi:hypothetical protein
VFELPVVAAPPTLDPDTRRLLQYTLAGAYVARHAQFLIALWDGEPPDKPGGTGDIVAFRRTGRFAALPADLASRLTEVPEPFALQGDPLDAPETGPVHHIVTPRIDRPIPANAFTGRRLAPAEYDHHPRQRQSYFAQLARAEYHLESFNIDAVRALAQDGPRVARSAERLHPGAFVPTEVAPLRNAFALADTLAHRYRHRTYRTFWTMLILTFLAVAAFEGYAALATTTAARIPWVVGYIGLLAAADAWYLWVRGRDVRNRFQDYRAFAEGLRVQFYWRLSGLAHAASDYYLRQQRDELMWIRTAIRAWGVWSLPVRSAEPHLADGLWVDAQRAYFADARRRSLAWLARDRNAGTGLIGASVGMTLIAAIRGGLDMTSPVARGIALGVLAIAALIFAHHANMSIHDAVIDTDDFSAPPLLGATEWWLLGGFAAGIGTALSARLLRDLVAVRYVTVGSDVTLTSEWHAWFVVAVVLTAVAGALLHAHADWRAFREHARRYRRMEEIFGRAGTRLEALRARGDSPGAGADTDALLVDLGREALAEQADWVRLHRERPVEPRRIEL